MPFTGSDPEMHEAELRGYREAEEAARNAREAALKAGPRLAWYGYLLRTRLLRPVLGWLTCLAMLAIVLMLAVGIILVLWLIVRRILELL